MAQAPKPTTEASIPDFPNVRYFIVLLIHPQPESGTAIYPPAHGCVLPFPSLHSADNDEVMARCELVEPGRVFATGSYEPVVAGDFGVGRWEKRTTPIIARTKLATQTASQKYRQPAGNGSMVVNTAAMAAARPITVAKHNLLNP